MRNFTEDHMEALQEVFNLGMGQAGSALGQLLDTYVTLTVPDIRFIDSSQLCGLFREQIGVNRAVSAVRQGFYCHMQGEVLMIFELANCHHLVEMMDYDEGDPWAERELLLDVSNILAGACLNCVAAQLQTEFSFSSPTLVCENLCVDALFSRHQMLWQYAMVTKIKLDLEARAFSCTILIFMSDDSVEKLGEALDNFIASYE